MCRNVPNGHCFVAAGLPGGPGEGSHRGLARRPGKSGGSSSASEAALSVWRLSGKRASSQPHKRAPGFYSLGSRGRPSPRASRATAGLECRGIPTHLLQSDRGHAQPGLRAGGPGGCGHRRGRRVVLNPCASAPRHSNFSNRCSNKWDQVQCCISGKTGSKSVVKRK